MEDMTKITMTVTVPVFEEVVFCYLRYRHIADLTRNSIFALIRTGCIYSVMYTPYSSSYFKLFMAICRAFWMDGSPDKVQFPLTSSDFINT